MACAACPTYCPYPWSARSDQRFLRFCSACVFACVCVCPRRCSALTLLLPSLHRAPPPPHARWHERHYAQDLATTRSSSSAHAATFVTQAGAPATRHSARDQWYAKLATATRCAAFAICSSVASVLHPSQCLPTFHAWACQPPLPQRGACCGILRDALMCRAPKPRARTKNSVFRYFVAHPFKKVHTTEKPLHPAPWAPQHAIARCLPDLVRTEFWQPPLRCDATPAASVLDVKAYSKRFLSCRKMLCALC